MHVTMVTTDFLPNIGGIATHVAEMAEALARGGTEVSILNVTSQPHLDTPISVRRRMDKAESVMVVDVRYRHGRSRAARHARRLLAVSLGFQFLSDHGRPPDVIHSHDYLTLALPCQRESRRTGAPWVWTNHSSRFLRDLESWRRRRIARAVHGGSDAIIAVSREIAEHTTDVFGGREVVFVPNGVQLGRFRILDGIERTKARSGWGLAPDEFVFVCARRFVWKNGIDVLLRALETWHEGNSGPLPFRVVFAGNESILDSHTAGVTELLDRLSRLVESGSAVALGNVPHDDVSTLFGAGDSVVMPSRYEAISLALLEGVASGCVPVTTAVGGLKEFHDRWRLGIQVPSDDPEALLQAMLLLANQGVSVTDRKACRRVAEQYSWDSAASVTLEIYERTLSRGKDA